VNSANKACSLKLGSTCMVTEQISSHPAVTGSSLGCAKLPSQQTAQSADSPSQQTRPVSKQPSQQTAVTSRATPKEPCLQMRASAVQRADCKSTRRGSGGTPAVAMLYSRTHSHHAYTHTHMHFASRMLCSSTCTQRVSLA